jgi:hypothetical protein
MNQHRLARWSCLLLVLLAGGSSFVMAAEEPAYEVVATRGDLEFRRYGPAIEAVTAMSGSGSSFKRLAGFIFGGNETGESIAMTAPVQENLSGETRHMAFIMPAEYSMAALPQPESPDVVLREVPERTVAVLSFSGRATESKVATMQRSLAEQLTSEGVSHRGDWLLNQYNPPWTLPILRRNEIWVEVDWPTDG